MVLAETYAPRADALLPPEGLQPSSLDPEMLYTEEMFHGPSWQGVAAIEQTGPSGAVARLSVLPHDAFFRDGFEPGFLLDPVVLDAAGQVVGFWTTEHLERGRIVFPFRLDVLDIHGPNPPAGGARHVCRIDPARGRAAGGLGARGGRPGRTTLDATRRLVRQAVRRPRPLRAPGPASERRRPFGNLARSRGGSPGARSRRVPVSAPELSADGGFWTQVWAGRVLSRRERVRFGRLAGSDDRKLGVAGRADRREGGRAGTARPARGPRRAARRYRAAGGRARAIPGRRRLARTGGAVPAVSIARSAGLAVALAALGAEGDEEASLVGVAVRHIEALSHDSSEPCSATTSDGSSPSSHPTTARRACSGCVAPGRRRPGGRCLAQALGDGATVVGMNLATGLVVVQLEGGAGRGLPRPRGCPVRSSRSVRATTWWPRPSVMRRATPRSETAAFPRNRSAGLETRTTPERQR